MSVEGWWSIKNVPVISIYMQAQIRSFKSSTYVKWTAIMAFKVIGVLRVIGLEASGLLRDIIDKSLPSPFSRKGQCFRYCSTWPAKCCMFGCKFKDP